MSMLLSENELASQDPVEFSSLLEEYASLGVNCFMEIGSMYGWSLQHFIHYANVGCAAVVIDQLIEQDDWRYEKQSHNSRHVWPDWARAKQCDLFVILNSSLKERTRRKVEAHLDGRRLDFLFIDGDHSYEAIKSDYESYSPLVRSGGLIAIHDVGYDDLGGGYQFWNEVRELCPHRDPNPSTGVLYP